MHILCVFCFTDAVNSGLLRKLIYTSYSKFLQNSATWCGADPRVVQLPLQVINTTNLIRKNLFHFLITYIFCTQFHSLYDDGSEELGWSHYIQPASIILLVELLTNNLIQILVLKITILCRIMSVLSSAPGMMTAIEKRLGRSNTYRPFTNS